MPKNTSPQSFFQTSVQKLNVEHSSICVIPEYTGLYKAQEYSKLGILHRMHSAQGMILTTITGKTDKLMKNSDSHLYGSRKKRKRE